MADPTGIGEVLSPGIAQAQANTSAFGTGASAMNAGLNTGMQLAQTQQAVQQKKLQTEQMQDELEIHKFNTLNSNMQILARSRPEVAKKLVPNMKERLQKSGIAVDPGVLDMMASDDNYKNRMLALSQTADQLGHDPTARQQFLAAHQDLGTFDKGLTQLEGYDKELSQQKVASMNVDKTIAAAKIGAQGRVEAAGITGGTRLEGAAQREFGRIISDPNVKPLLVVHQQGVKDLQTINDALDNDKALPVQTLNELSTGLGSMISNAGSSLSERDSQSMHNLRDEIAKLTNKASTEGVATIKDPVRLKQMKEQFERLMDATETNALNRAEGLKRPIKNQYLNAQQDEAIKNLHETFSRNRESAKAPSGASQPAQQSAGALKTDPKFREFMDKASKMPGFNAQKAEEVYKSQLKGQ